MPLLPLPAGSTVASAAHINNRGQVLANARFGTGLDSFVRPYIWDEGEITMLGLLPDARGAAAGSMNAQAVVVGATTPNDGNASQIATVWRHGRPADLDTLICADDRFHSLLQLVQAFAINDRGQIVAWGVDENIFDVGYYFLDPSRP
jgi:uncharacterized membrane protein